MNIYVTNDRKEMIELGKKIFAEKPQLYTDKLKQQIMDTIEERYNSYKAETKQALLDKEELFFLSVYDYWVYGNNISEEFYYHFYEKDHEEKSKYLTCRNRFLYIEHLNKREDAHCLINKWEAYQRFKPFYKRDVLLITGEQDYEAFCEFVAKHTSYVVKPTDLALAMGVHKVELEEGFDKRQVFEALLMENEEVAKKYQWNSRERDAAGTLLLEEIIEQDEIMAELHPASANSIRCNTIRVGDEIQLYCPWIKIGVAGEFVTSGAVGSVLAGVNSETGIIETDGYTELGELFEKHPTTGVKLRGFQIPKWEELVTITKTIAKELPSIGYIGWDMVLSKKGWCIMEGNYSAECLWQIVYQKGMKAEMEDLLGWKPDKAFWWEK